MVVFDGFHRKLKKVEKMRPELVLASGSPRRRELLNQLSLKFRVETSQADERVPEGRSPGEVVEELALRKAMAVAADCEDAIVIGSDTVVVCDGEILGKPRDVTEAVKMLKHLAGRSHEVYTGIALVQVAEGNTVRTLMDHRRTEVWMRPLSDEQIRWYVATGEPMDKAGAYGIQGLGACLVDKIDGCYFNVVGMSLSLLDQMMEKLGFSLRDFA
jgi:septum formation protein